MKRLILGAGVLMLHLIALGTLRVASPGARFPTTDPRPVFKLVDLRGAAPAGDAEADPADANESTAGETAERERPGGDAPEMAEETGGPVAEGGERGAGETQPPANEARDRGPEETAAPPKSQSSPERAGSPARGQSRGNGGGVPTFYPIHLVTVPPRIPAEELRRRIRYPYAARRRGVEGVVYLELYIDDSGRVVRAEVVDGPGHGLNEAAREAFRDLTVTPARRDNEAVAVRYRYPVRFELE